LQTKQIHGWDNATRSVLNALPGVLLIGGLPVLTFGLLPRLTVAVPPTTLAGIMIQVTD